MKYTEFYAVNLTTGQALPSSTAAVYLTGTLTPASLFDSGGSPIANPVTATATGLIAFGVADGIYDIQITSADHSYTAPPIYKQQIFDESAFSSVVRILSKNTDYSVTAADVFSGSVIIEVDASGGAVTITVPLARGNSVSSPTVRIVKIDTSANPVVVNDGTNPVDAITAPATALGQIGGWRNVYSNGTNLRSSGVG